MPLIEEAALRRHLLSPANGAGEPPLQRMTGTLAEAAQSQAHHFPDGTGSLAGVLGSEMSMHDVLSRRRSVRVFNAKPAPVAELAVIAQAGLAAERRVRPAEAHDHMGMAFVLAALNVAGLPPGLYLSTADVREPFSLMQHEPAWMQELRQRYADAPAMLMVCGDAPSACRALGKRGYGQILLLAAAAGHAAWLRAISLGMAGTVFGGTCHQVTASLAQTHSPQRWHLFTLAVGYRADTGEENSHRD
jgi:hypothetical protein